MGIKYQYMFRPLWIEVNIGFLEDNFKLIKSLVSEDVEILPMIKQSAYGHGLIPVAKCLSQLGVKFFGVGSLEEAINLRHNGFKERILVLTGVLPEYAKEFVEYNITAVIVDNKFAQNLNHYAKEKNIKAPIHIKIDTGMSRLGYDYQDAYDFILNISQYKNIFLEGIYTHFPVADTDEEFTSEQIDNFNSLIAKLKSKGINFNYKHLSNSIGIIKYPNAHFNMVRPGLILYGIKPLDNLALKIKPIISLKSKIIFIKKIAKGKSIGYGRTFILKEDSLIATVAIGYADGYPWAIGNNHDHQPKVIIKDSFFPIVGRVCMDHIMVNLGLRDDIKIGEEVILIGQKDNLEISPSDVALWAKTIPYEIISHLSDRIPRIYSPANVLITS